MINERELKKLFRRLMTKPNWFNKCKLFYWFGEDGDYISGYDDGECIGNEPFNS